MNEPQNFASYRDNELNVQRINAFNTIKDTAYLSKRFMLKKYLQLSDMEISENDKMWAEEQNIDVEQTVAGSDLRNVGVTPGAISSDLETLDSLENMPDEFGNEPGASMQGGNVPPVGSSGPGAPGTSAAATPTTAGPQTATSA